MQDLPAAEPVVDPAAAPWWRHWWRRQTPTRQDRFAMLAPLAAVLLFLAAFFVIAWRLNASFWKDVK